MGAAAKAHGLDGGLVDPDWAPLAQPEVRQLLDQFPDCGEPMAILSMSPRPFSAACVVRTATRKVFVKRHHLSVRDREGLLEEHRFVRHLCEGRAGVPRVLTGYDGETAIVKDGHCYEVHEVPEAVDLYGRALSWTPFRSVAHARSAGASLARLHQVSEGFNAPCRMPRPLVASFTLFACGNPEVGLERYLQSRPALAGDALVRASGQQALLLLAPFHAELAPLLPALTPLWTHNDLHASNLLWTGTGLDAQVSAIIDFGLADRTNAVHDLAHAIERNIVEWLALVRQPSRPEDVPLHLDAMRAFLDGYESVRALSDNEADALAPMVALCHAEFALSEADYFLGVLHSRERAIMAYDGWLVGHARWFRTPRGAQLLQSLRQWAACRKCSGTSQ